MKGSRKQENRYILEDMSENLSVQYQHGGEKRHRGKFTLSHRQNEVLFFCILVILIVILFLNAVKVISTSTKETYDTVKEEKIQSVYDSFYVNSFNATEAKTHVSNNIAIRIEDIQEMANLEVLQASDVEYVVTDKEDNPENITSWIEVPGTGIFTVDLSSSEFIVDSQRQYVLIRIPRPILSNFKVDNKNVKQLLWKDDVFNGSVKAGEDEVRNQISVGAMRLKEYLISNRMIYENAVNSAKNIIESLVRQFNPEISDLTVEVEIIEDI